MSTLVNLAKIPLIYLIGAPRSGTTWLQRMLGSHPQIATPQETDLYNRYIDPLLQTWRTELPSSFESATFEGWERRRYKGLPAIITTDELLEHVRDLISDIYGSLLKRKPSASTVLEKNPEYSLCTDLIVTIAPHARFIHLVRDGRDVALSLTRAAAGWGWWWAPSRLDDAARRWAKYVDSAQMARDAPGGYLEVRYEELSLSSGAERLEEIFEFCGVTVGDSYARSLLDQYRLGEPTNARGGIVWSGEVAKHVKDEPKEPLGFAGERTSSSWRQSFDAYDRRLFDHIAGERLVDLGYETGREWSRVGGARGAAADTRLRGNELLARLKSLTRRISTG